LRKGLFAGAFCAATAIAAAAQAPSRIATTPEALTATPVFFHGKQVVIRRATLEARGLVKVASTTKPIYVFWREPSSGGPDKEIRGEFWDLGRLERDDPRFANLDLAPVLNDASQGQWPPRDHVFLLLGATAIDSPLPQDPTIRAIALAPEEYKDRSVTVVGRFRGANLYGDLPLPVGKGRWDFVLQSADAAIWVTGMRPRGKGFTFDPGSRVDTGHWLQVTGVARHDGTLPWIEATAMEAASAPTETPVEVTVQAVPTQPAPEVIFTAPLAGETDVEPTSTVRIQFSRDMDPASFRGHVRAGYVGAPPAGAPTTIPAFTFRYNEGNRSLELKFSAPLDRLRQVRVDLGEGIQSAGDNQPLAPWSLTFTTGG
jgi:hypothetical protein